MDPGVMAECGRYEAAQGKTSQWDENRAKDRAPRTPAARGGENVVSLGNRGGEFTAGVYAWKARGSRVGRRRQVSSDVVSAGLGRSRGDSDREGPSRGVRGCATRAPTGPRERQCAPPPGSSFADGSTILTLAVVGVATQREYEICRHYRPGLSPPENQLLNIHQDTSL